MASHLRASAASPVSTVSDGPGALSHFDLARKDCLGTARNTTSKVWFTIANGVLSDVYYPTIDNTNVETLQYIVTDGSTFTDLQTRDTTYTVQSLSKNSNALDCEVTTTAKSGKYRIVTDYLTDPDRNTLVMNVHFIALVGDLSAYQLYVRYDPSINGNGGGGSGNAGGDNGTTIKTSTGHTVPVAFDTVTKSNAANRDYAEPVYSALDASTLFTKVSNGFAGQPSDGLVQLDASHNLTAIYSQANDGNLVHTRHISLIPQRSQ
jgi:glucoamylase